MTHNIIRMTAALALALGSFSPAIKAVAQDARSGPSMTSNEPSAGYTVILNAGMGDVGDFRGRVGVAIFSEKRQAWSSYKVVEGLLSMEVRALKFAVGPDFGPVTKVRVWSENGMPLSLLGQATPSADKVKFSQADRRPTDGSDLYFATEQAGTLCCLLVCEICTDAYDSCGEHLIECIVIEDDE